MGHHTRIPDTYYLATFLQEYKLFHTELIPLRPVASDEWPYKGRQSRYR